MLKIRKAAETDRLAAASLILASFKEDFAIFVKCLGQDFVLDFLGKILVIKRFYVAEQKSRIIGLAAFSDSAERATRLDRQQAGRQFGRIRTFLISLALKDFEIKLTLPSNTGYVEYVAVAAAFQGQGVASQLLKESMAMAGYQTYVLEVKDSNFPAIRCYHGLGFKEKARKKKSFFYPAKDFKNWIWMERPGGQ